MRGIAVFMFSFIMVSGADASSIVVFSGKQASDPSIVALGEAQKADSSLVVAGATEPGATASPSLVILGNPAVNTEKVAAIPAGKRQSRAGNVLVIRAGVVGGSSAAPVATAVAASAATPAAAGNSDGQPKTLRDAMTQAGQAPAVAQ